VLRSFVQNRLQDRPELLDDNPITLSGRVNAVTLVQPGLSAYAFEKERHVREGMLVGEVTIDPFKTLAILFSVIHR